MKKVFTSDNFVLAGHVHSLLEANNIECHLRNMNLTGGIGELPINECWPEVWINNETDFHSAEKLIKTALDAAPQQDAWQCQCGELIEGQFELCWSCGKERK
ncbi:MAG: DUF2007 domain-containing protein [Gammaproteobacteria bacterium]|jgi:hypothetical protein